jgi:modified peptide precursor CbpA
MAKGVPTCAEPPFFIGLNLNTTHPEEEEEMQQINPTPAEKNTVNAAKSIGFRYSCGLNGSNTGLSHYILLDKKN